LKKLMLDAFCPDEEISRMEDELRNIEVKNHDIAAYNHRFNELAMLCHEIFSTEKKKIKQYISGLPSSIKGETMSLKLLEWLMPYMSNGLRIGERGKVARVKERWMKWTRGILKLILGKRIIKMAPTANVNQAPLVSKCDRFGVFYVGNCPRICSSCHLVGHVTKDCRVKGKASATGANTVPVRVCYRCGDPTHLANSDQC
nr:hypothetical protein [Tanacetum cinerariifolium]